MDTLISGVKLTQLKIISHTLGDIYHGLKKSECDYSGFGESYFSTVKYGAIKGWKKHLNMTINLIVPIGEVMFVIYDDRNSSNTNGNFLKVFLSINNYQRLTVEPGLWVAFKGLGMATNLVQNISNLEHDPNEAENRKLSEIQYNWE